MIAKCLCVLALVLWSAGCNRQHNQQPQSNLQPVSGPAGGQAGATTAPPSAAASNPGPVQRPPVEAVVPSETSDPSQPSQPAPALPSQTAQSSMPAPAPAAVPAPASPVPAAGEVAVANPVVNIPAGTRIRVRLGQSLDSKHSRPGERFVAYLDYPVISGDRVVVPKGTAFEGHVIEAKSSGRLRGRAYLGVKLDSFRLHGYTYPITTAADVRASKSHKRRNLAIIGGSAGTGATIGAVAGGGVGAAIGAGAGAAAGTTTAFITGKKNVRLPVETPLVFSLRGAIAVRG